MSFARREFEKLERESRGDRTARDNTKRLQQELDRAYARIEELEEEVCDLRNAAWRPGMAGDPQ